MLDALFEMHMFQEESVMNVQKLFGCKLLASSRGICRGGLIFLMAMFVAGCSHDFVLRKPDGTVIGPGTIDYGQSSSAGTVMLSINGVIYRGPLESHKVDESRSIAANDGLNSRKYQAYSLGNGNYLREGRATLHSDHGEVLKCEFSYRGVNGRGNCESGSEKFDVLITEAAQTLRDATN